MSTATLPRAVTYARTAVYCRVSRDRVGAGLAVARQLAECQALAERDGLRIVAETADNDVSGYSGKPREGYAELVALIESGAVDVLLCWHTDRLTRRLIELADLIALCKTHNVRIVSVVSGALDPNDAGAVMQAQIMGTLAEYESAVKSERIRSKHKQLAEAGAMHGGTRRFGYSADMSTLDEAESEVLRQIAGKILTGSTVASCARWLNDQGITGTKGAKWTGPNLRTLILRPYLAGLRVHRGKVTGAGAWPAVLDLATHEALKARLGDPARRTNKGSNARKHLLSGLATCGTCGGTVSTVKRAQHTGRAYACRRGCINRQMEQVDQRVTDWIVERLRGIDPAGMLADDETVIEVAELSLKRTAIPDRIAALRAKWAAGDLSDADWEADRDALNAQAATLDTAIARLSEILAAPQRALKGLTGTTPDAVFDDLDLGRKRAVIGTLCTVKIVKAARRGAAFDPQTVVIEPRDM